MVDAGSGAMAASLVDAAVTAAVRAGAPRRTVAAARAAVATAVMAAWRGGGAQDGDSEQALAAPAAASRRRRNKKKRNKKLDAGMDKEQILGPAASRRGGSATQPAPEMDDDIEAWCPMPQDSEGDEPEGDQAASASH